MKEILLEFLICGIVSVLLMILHEFPKAVVYKMRKRTKKVYNHRIWELHRYIDPVGVILAVTSSVTFSKPFMLRIRDKKTNLLVGCTGFLVLLGTFLFSICLIRLHPFGLQGMTTLQGQGMFEKIVTLALQYTTLLSLGMLLTNLFPVSTFDMGLLIAGFSSEKYLNIIKRDFVIKTIYILCVLVGLPSYGAYRLINFLV